MPYLLGLVSSLKPTGAIIAGAFEAAMAAADFAASSILFIEVFSQ